LRRWPAHSERFRTGVKQSEGDSNRAGIATGNLEVADQHRTLPLGSEAMVMETVLVSERPPAFGDLDLERVGSGNAGGEVTCPVAALMAAPGGG